MEKQLRVEANFDMLQRKIVIGGKMAGFFFIDGFVQEDMIEKLMQFFYSLKPEDLQSVDSFLEKGMPYTEINKIDKVSDAITAFLSGVTIIFIDGFDICISLDCRTYPMRSVTEPWKDRVLRGSRDGFVETLVMNAALIRRRIRDPKLSLEMMGVGTRSRSDVAICYMEDKVDKKLLENIKTRIQSIQVEALTMNIESLAECLYEHKWINPFPKFKYSERPDTAAAAVLDGNIVIMVDNSPAVMIVPTSIFDIIEEADDYNFAPVIGTYLRLSRFLLTLVTLLLTPTWLLLINHVNWLPEWLKFITVADEITVPVFYQLLLLELAVDGLKLAAVNTPTLLSTPLSDGQVGIRITGSKYTIKNLIVQKAPDNGIQIKGSSAGNNTVENCIVRYNNDAGVQITGGAYSNTIKFVYSYRNCDVYTLGGNADGYAPKLGAGKGNVFYGCYAWENSDDGWDSYDKDSLTYDLTYTNCACWNNGDPTIFTGEYDYQKGNALDTDLLLVELICKKDSSFASNYKNGNFSLPSGSFISTSSGTLSIANWKSKFETNK